MFSKTFIVAEDKEYGEIGLMPSWIASPNAGRGALIPHDMFEHSATARFGAAEEEFMAIGAAYRIRGENGFFQIPAISRQNSDVLSHDVYAILTDLSNSERGNSLAAPRNTYKLKDEQAEFVCQAAARKGIKMAVTEWKSDASEECTDASDNIISDALGENRTFAELQKIVAGWMRIGYTNVQRRFPKIDLYSLAYLYKSIGKDVDRMIVESYPGDRVRVTVDLRLFSYIVKNLEHRYNY